VRKAVVNLASARKVWRAPPATGHAIRDAFGGEWSVVEVTARTSSDGDGGGPSPAALRAAAGAEVYIGWGVPSEVVTCAQGTLRWAHTAAAGAGASITPALRASGATLTNAAGIYAEPIADWTLTAIGYCLRGYHAAVAAQVEGRWAKDELTDGSHPVREFADATVGIVGLGGLGRAVAARCVALGTTVCAVRRRPEAPAPAGLAWVGGPDDLARLAAESDVLVLAAPRAGDAGALVTAPVLEAMPRGSYVINVARGVLVDEVALLRALDSGQIAGCVLDVFAHEPLPAGHPFWRHPRVLVFPHVSGVSDRFWPRQTDLITDNVARFLAGRPLRNVVDLDAGY